MHNIHNDPLLAELQRWVTAMLCDDQPAITSADARKIVHRHSQVPAHRSGASAPADSDELARPQADKA
jgi:hypothetical protein